MRISPSKCLFIVLALTAPVSAHAQNIPPIIVAIAVSPVLVILLAVVVGILYRSWLVGATHAGLVVVWVVLTAVASYWVENDYVIWTPLVIYCVHAIILIVLVFIGVLRRVSG
jgi:uncharacterized protein YggT (Ycf19 family)